MLASYFQDSQSMYHSFIEHRFSKKWRRLKRLCSVLLSFVCFVIKRGNGVAHLAEESAGLVHTHLEENKTQLARKYETKQSEEAWNRIS